MLTLILKRAGGLFMPLWLAVVFCVGAAMDAHAQAPPNDNLTNAQPLVGSSGTVYGDNINATAETNLNEPGPYINPPQSTIWYLWTAPFTTTMSFNTRNSTDTTIDANQLGTVMAIYTLRSGSNVAYTNLLLLASNEFDPSSGVTNAAMTNIDEASRIDLPVVVGQTYLIQLDGSTNNIPNGQPNNTSAQGYMVLNWSPSLVGGTFAFSSTTYFAGEFDDTFFVNCEPESIDPSLHNAKGTNNIRITVTRQAGYTGRCEVTLLVTNGYYTNILTTNYSGTNIYTSSFDSSTGMTTFTNTFFTNIATENLIQEFINNSGTSGKWSHKFVQLPVFGLSTFAQSNLNGALSPPTINFDASLVGLGLTNFFTNFNILNLTITNAPVVSGTVTTTTITQYFVTNITVTNMIPSASNTLDYVAYSNTLVFNDFQMSQDVYLQVNPESQGEGILEGPDFPDTNGNYLYFGANSYVVMTLTNAMLDPAEDPDITPPTISTNAGNAYLGIMSLAGNPQNYIGSSTYLTTNSSQVDPDTFQVNYSTINLERATFRVNKPGPNTGTNGAYPSSNTVYLYLVLEGSPGLGDTYTVNYSIDLQEAGAALVDVGTGDAFKWNGFPTVAGSDYAQNSHFAEPDYDFSEPVPAPGGGSPGPCPITDVDTSTWAGNYGTATFGPFNNNGGADAAEIAIPIYNWGASEFDVDMIVQLFFTASSNPNLGNKNPGFLGNITSANLTINYSSGVQPGGAYDLSFNPVGSPTASYPPNNPDPGCGPPPADGGVVQAVAIQPNGQAVIGGFFTSYNTTPVYSIARLLPNGWLDTGFNNVTDGGVNGTVKAIKIDANGNIIIGGSFSSYDGNLTPAPNIARLTPNGSLDTTFNTGNGFNSAVFALAIDANGNILVGGDFTSYNTTPCNHIARLLPNGALDTTFIPDTGNGLPNFGTDNDVRAVATDGNGRIILGGDFTHANGSNYNYLVRLLPNGAIDTTFNPEVGPDGSVLSMAVVPGNNEILIGGAFQNYNLVSSSGVALVGLNGLLDTSFTPGSGSDGNVYSVALQTNNGVLNVLVGGQFRNFNSTRRLGIARLLTNGWVDTSFMDTSYNQFAGLINSYYNEEVEATHTAYALGVQPDGNIILGGSFTNIGGGVARDSINSQINVTRLIGASTPGPMTGGGGIGNYPGNITLTQNPYTVNDTGGKLFVTLDRVNGSLGPAQATLGTNTLAPGAGSASAADFGLILPAMPLYNSYFYALNGGNVLPFGTYGWKVGDGFYGNNTAVQPSFTAGQNDAALNLNIYNDPAAQQNLLASLSLLNVNELNITNNSGGIPAYAAPLELGGVLIPCFPALGTPSASLEIINNNFPVGYIGFSATNYTAVNTSNSVTITVLRTNGSYGPINVTYYTANGTALANSNYTAIPLSSNKTLSFSGNNSATFNIPILNSGMLSSNKFFRLLLTNTSPPGVLFTNSQPILWPTSMVTIIDGNFTSGHLSFTAPSYTVTKGGLATVNVQRTGGALGELTVQCVASNLSTTNGLVCVGVTNTLTWSNQDVSVKPVTIQTLNDSAFDGNLTNNVYLVNATNVGSTNNDGLILYPPTNASLIIQESDFYGNLNFAAPLNYGLPNFNIMQNAGQALITVIRTGGTAGTITVNYVATNLTTNIPPGYLAAEAGTNFGATNGTLTFGPGVTSQSFIVPVYYTPAETNPANLVASLELFNGSSNVSGQFPLYATLTIVDPELVHSPAGSVDSSTQNGTGFNGYVDMLAMQPDGSVLAGGNFTFFNQYPFEYVARLNTGGNFDNTFLFDQSGANGEVFQVLSQTTNSTQTNNGSIVIAGSFTSVDGVTRNGITRLNIDGSMDETFNPGSGADSTIFALVQTLLPTGVIGQTNLAYYIGGNFANFNGIPSGGIARLNASSNSPGYQGTVDPNFNVGQGVTSANAAIHALAIQADNSVIAGGNFTSFNSSTNYQHLVRLNSAGVVDAAFHPGTGSNAVNSVQAIAIQPDGRILVGGSFTNVTVGGNSYNLNFLARLNTDGSVDTNFNVGLGGNNSVLALAIDSQQRILVGGEFTRFSGVTRSGITRLNPDGTVDPTINFGTGADGGFVDTIAIQGNDEINVAGGFSTFQGMNENNFVRLYGGANSGNGSIEFTEAIFGVLLNGTNASVTLQRLGGEGASNGPPVSIFFSTSDGTAVAGTDYTAVMTNVVFPPGETFVTVLIPIINNSVVSSNKTLNLNLSNPINTTIGAQASATLIITNVNTDVEFSAPTYRDSANVPGGYAIIPVERIGNPNSTVSVAVYTGTNGSATPNVNYIPNSTNLTFNPGVTNIDFQVFLLNPTNTFSDQTVDLELSNPINTVITNVSDSPSNNATLTIANVYTSPGFLSFSQTNYIVSEGATNAVITVVRTNGSSGSVSVLLTTANGTATAGSNYIALNTNLNFADGVTSQSTNITVIQQSNASPDTTVFLTLSNPQGGASIGAANQATLTIQDDIEDFSFAQPTYSIFEGNVLSVYVVRAGLTTNTASVGYTTYSPANANDTNGYAVPNVDYVPVSGTLVFNPNVTQQSIPIQIPQGNVVNGPLTFQVVLDNPTASNSTIVQLTPPYVNTVTILNDLTVFAFSTNSYAVGENGSNIVITVDRINSTNPAGSVQFATSNGTNQNSGLNALSGVDYVATNGTLNFSNGATSTNFTVTILNPNLVESNKTFDLTLSNPLVNSTNAYLGANSNAVVVITNNLTGVSFGSPTYAVSECSGLQAVIPVSLSGATNNAVNVSFGTSNGTAFAGTSYFATNGTLHFAAGQTATNIFVSVINNHISGPNITAYVILSNVQNARLLSPSNTALTIEPCNGFTNFSVSAFASSAFISWDTTVPAMYQVAYGLTTNYTSVTSLAGPSTNPVVLLTGLKRDTNYYFNALSWENGTLYTTNGMFTTVDTIILNTINASYSGSWSEGSFAITNYYGSYYNVANTTPFNPTASATYTPTIITPGVYNVFTWYPTNVIFSTNTQMYVSGTTNEFQESINQTINGGSWQPLGTNLYFTNGMSGSVIIYNDTGETNKQVAANAMKWSYVTNQDYATNGVVPAWWSSWWSSYLGTNVAATRSNYAAYVLGTQPDSLPNGTNFWASFPSNRTIVAYFTPYQGGRVYQLQTATNLTSTNWLSLTNMPVFTTNSITNMYGVFTNSQYGVITTTFSNATQTYFRLSVQPSTNY